LCQQARFCAGIAGSVRRFTNDTVVVFVQQHAQNAAHHPVVISQHEAERWRELAQKIFFPQSCD
jgi:hypothetical protein